MKLHTDPCVATQVALHTYAIECNRLLQQIERKARYRLVHEAPEEAADAVRKAAARGAQRLAGLIGEALALTSLLHDAMRALDSLGAADEVLETSPAPASASGASRSH
jgi:hypothetical protein